MTIHGLRRTFAVLLQEAGAQLPVIRQALGHGARGVTETHYLPRRDATVQRWVDAIEVSVPGLDHTPGRITAPMLPTNRGQTDHRFYAWSMVERGKSNKKGPLRTL